MFPETGKHRQSGLGLIAALFLIVVVALLVAAILSLVRTSGTAFSQDVMAQRALMAAESGVQLSLNRLYAPVGVGACFDATWNFTQDGLSSCSAIVSCTQDVVGSDVYYTIESTGHCDNGSNVAERSVVVRSQP